jgi:hypothetical protein
MRNSSRIINAFRNVKGWQKYFSNPNYLGFDEGAFCEALNAAGGRLLFRETYSTPVATSDMRWYWRNGVLSNEFYPHRGFPYLHFMHWRSSRWYRYQKHVRPGAKAPWQYVENPIKADWRKAGEEGFMISPQGIEPIVAPEYTGC